MVKSFSDDEIETRLLTPAGLTDVLREAGGLPSGRVTSLEISERIQTTVSNLVFVVATYSSAAASLPNRLVLKWPLPETVTAGAVELEFYRQLAPSLTSPPIVRCLAAARVADGPHWLLLEDLRLTHSNPPWPLPPAHASAESAVEALAQVHARWWEAPTLGKGVGDAHTDQSLRTMVRGFADKLPSFLASLGDTLPAQDQEVLERVFGSSWAPWLRLLEPRALTVTHGDAHTWNFLFPRDETGPLYLIDWQLWHLDVGARDLAFMIALHWYPSHRRDVELPLLRHYHRRLVDYGILHYSFDELWLDYRRCAVRNLTFPIILWGRGLPPEAWRHRLECAIAAYRDLHCAELL